MRIGLSVDQLSTDAHLVARPPDASFEDIAHAQLATDLFRADRFVPIGEGGIARDHETVPDSREVRRQILGDAVGKVLLVGVVTEVSERQYDNRHTWRD